MRRVFIILVLAMCGIDATAQYKDLVSNDPQGDADLFVVTRDLKTISYMMSAAKDSIYFKIVTYDTLGDKNSIGFAFAIDSNESSANGDKLPGCSATQNKDWKFDHALYITKLPNASAWKAEIGVPNMLQNVTSSVNISHPDKYTFIVRAPMALIDKNGKFAIVVGAGEAENITGPYVCTMHDAAPNSGSAQVNESGATNIAFAKSANGQLKLYPNPASGTLNLYTDTNLKGVAYTIYTITGQKAGTGVINNDNKIDIGSLSKGNYIINIHAGQKMTATFSVN